MLCKQKQILFFFTTFFFFPGVAAQEKYRAVQWGLKEGLSQGCVYQMLKDVNGFLWIGTQGGLSRFDGSTFKNYYHDPQKSGTINAGTTLGGMVEDSMHNIWIGTDKGLFRYDIKADTFTHFLPALGLASSNTWMWPFWATRNELFCVESDSIITTYNIRSFAKKNVATLTSKDTAWSFQYSFFDVQSNSIWMLRNYNEIKGQPMGGGLLQVSLLTGGKKYYRWNFHKNIPGRDHSAEAMCYDRKRNCLWINTPDGLIQFTLDDKQFHYVSALNNLLNVKGYDRWVGISLDHQNRVWLATKPKGMVIYDPSGQSVTFPFAEGTELQKEISDYNACIYCDRDGIIWSGFWLRKGIYQVIPFSPSVRNYKTDTSTAYSLKPGNVINFKNAGEGKIWIGLSDGLALFDPHTNKFQALEEKNLSGLKGKAILPVLIDTILQKAYLGTDTGYLIMDLNTKKCQPLIYKDSANHEIKVIEYKGECPFREGLFIGAILDNRESIFWLNRGSEVAHEVLSFPVNSIIGWSMNAFDDGFMFLRRPDVLGNLTYVYLNNKWIRSHSPLDSIQWSKMIYNKKDQGYWVLAEKQLLHYGKDIRLIRTYTPADGLPDIDIYSLLADTRGNIWFNTDRSIHQLNVETGVFSTLSEKDGFQPQNFSGYTNICMGTEGDLYLGGAVFGEGFVRISPDKYTYTSSSVYLRSLEVNQESFPLSTGVNDLQELSLRYFQNKITIETGVIDYYSKGSSHIRYKLEGLNNKWQYGPANYTIRFDGLPAHKYKLVMQSSNAANEFIGPQKVLFINISPAFWNTWWFRTVAALSLVALLYGLVRWRLKQKFRMQLERSEREMQVAVLKQKASELEMQALRAQMSPHFVFNSLNSINRFILQNNRAQASEYLTKFSKLVRLILQNSQASLITLDSELESLELYLTLEALRFNYHFNYKISVPKDMDVSALQLPPLILQPYVENAIWHGLMHKEEKGQLDIDLSEEDDHLYFRITDNGIGREKASALASKSATKHKSMGLRITAQRIAIMQNSQTQESPVTINDLLNTDGSAAGTEVIIKMPVIYD